MPALNSLFMVQFPWPAAALFLVLLAASLCGFWLRFRKVWRTVLLSKKDPDFSIHPVARRVRDFVWEVLLQGKVIRERPLPGLAHAFVFWGFCAFALVSSTTSPRAWLRIPLPRWLVRQLLLRLSRRFSAVLVAVSIAGLFIRRFVVRPKWLGASCPGESGLIALLIFLLMVTYLGTFLPGGERKRNHCGGPIRSTLLVFLPLIPHTKHLHLVLSPLTVFLKRDGFSEIPPLVGDDDFGLDTGKDITQLVSLQAYTCVECGRCTEHCPAYNTGKVLNPKEIVLGLRGYLNEFGPISAKTPLLGKYLSQEAAFQCTTCGACEFQCPVGMQHLPIIIGLRRGAVNTGKWEDDYGTKLFLNLERNGNSLGFIVQRARQVHPEARVADLRRHAGILPVAGLHGRLRSAGPRDRRIVRASDAAPRHHFRRARKEKCTGDPARRLGNDLAFGSWPKRIWKRCGRVR